jgi:hypothetical protein
VAELAACGLVPLGDKGYLGEDHIRTPYRGRNKAASQKQANRAHARLRAPGERAHAQFKTLAYLAQAPLLPMACRAARQGHPRPSGPRNRRMNKVQWKRARSPRPQSCNCPAGLNVRTTAAGGLAMGRA